MNSSKDETSEMSAGDVLLGRGPSARKEEEEKEEENVQCEDAKLSKMFSKLTTLKDEPHLHKATLKAATGGRGTVRESSVVDYFNDDTYDMSCDFMGHALIINNENFHRRTQMNKRSGTVVDGENLQRMFKELGFKVHYLYDATLSDISKMLQTLARHTDHGKSNCFAMALLSHGDGGEIYATDGTLPIKDIVDMFRAERCPSLLGKPKIFFFQACRGSEHEVGMEASTDCGDDDDSDVTDGIVREEYHGDRVVYVDEASAPTIPAGADFIFCYSVAEGFYSHRDTKFGSWYIQDLTAAMQTMVLDKKVKGGDGDHQQRTRHDLVDVLTTVSRMVSQRSVERSYNFHAIGKKQMPVFHSLLTKKLYFY